MNKFIITFSLIVASMAAQSQSAKEVISQCVEALGGKNWESVNGLRYTTNVEQGGMKIPLEVVALRDGRTYTKITFQGMEIIQGAYDGTTVWSTNFMTQKPEKAEADDAENTRRSAGDFPNALANYEKAGYKATLEGEENIDGVACHKIKMEKKTMLAEGVEVPNIEYYYIDKDSKALIMTESEIKSGEMKGQIAQTKLSDYQETGGVYMPYSQTVGLKDGQSQSLTFDKIEVNPVVVEETFKYKGE